MIWMILQLAGILFFPSLAIQIARRVDKSWLSPVIICYGVGIILANLPGISLDEALNIQVSEGSIILAIPLLLFSTRLLLWIRLAGPAVLSFGLAVIAATISTVSTAIWWNGQIEAPEKLAGMLSGLYTGGTPNMQAVGLALDAPSEYIVLINGADIILGGAWLVFLISFAPLVIGKFFPPFQEKEQEEGHELLMGQPFNLMDNIANLILGLIFSIGVAAAAAGLTFLLFGDLGKNIAFLLLSLTTLSLALSFIPFIRELPGTMKLGEYLLLVFSLAIGLQAKLGLLAESGAMVFLFCLGAKIAAILLHMFLARLFGIDRDTYLITSTSALYGPVFVPQVASVLKNNQLVFAGIATGLLGYAIGNYLGIGIGTLLGYWL